MRSYLQTSRLALAPAAALLLSACRAEPSDSPVATPPLSSTVGTSVELVIERLSDLEWSASLVNHGAESVVVVLPGDGSADGWRTPIVRWTVVGEAGETEPPGGGRCGNVNALDPDEVVTLDAGESVSINRYGLSIPMLPRSGSVEVSLTYENVPNLVWSGEPMGTHDSHAMARVHASTPLSLRSNVVRVERAPVEGEAK